MNESEYIESRQPDYMRPMTDTPLTDAAFAEYPVLDTQRGGDAITIQAARKIETSLRAQLAEAQEAARDLNAAAIHWERKFNETQGAIKNRNIAFIVDGSDMTDWGWMTISEFNLRLADLREERVRLASQLLETQEKLKEAEKRIAAINGQRNVMANAVNSQNWSMFWEADKVIGELVAGNCDHLLAQQLAQLLALQAHVGELERVIENLRGWITANAKTPIHAMLEYTDNTVRRKPDLTLIEEVREGLEKIQACVGFPHVTDASPVPNLVAKLLTRLSPRKD